MRHQSNWQSIKAHTMSGKVQLIKKQTKILMTILTHFEFILLCKILNQSFGKMKDALLIIKKYLVSGILKEKLF